MKIISIQGNETMLPYDTPLNMVLPFYLNKDGIIRTMQQSINQTNKHSKLRYVNE